MSTAPATSRSARLSTLSRCPGAGTRATVSPQDGVDGSMRWESHGALSKCGAAYATELLGAPDARRETEAGEIQRLATGIRVSGSSRTLVPAAATDESRPRHAPPRARPAGDSARPPRGRDRLRGAARGESARLGVTLGGPRPSHRRAPALAGAGRRGLLLPPLFGAPLVAVEHVDVRAFLLAGLPLLPRSRDVGHRGVRAAAAASHRPRSRTIAARLPRRGGSVLRAANAQLGGYRGAQFPWESSLRFGEEAAPDEGAASGREHHVSLDVAHAFAQFVHATGDLEYARTVPGPSCAPSRSGSKAASWRRDAATRSCA